MRRRTRGGRNIKSLEKRVTRRKQSANLARKAKEKANEAIQESDKLRQQIQELLSGQKSEFNLQELVLRIIHLSGDKPIVDLDDYLNIEFDPRLIHIIDEQATILANHKQQNQSYINFKRGLLQQTLHHANELSTNTEIALRLSALTPLSNRPGMSNEDANIEWQKLQSKTNQNLKIPITSSEQSNSILFERMKLSIQVAQEMERMTYNRVSSKPAIRTPLSIHDRTILGENDIHMMDFVKSHDPAYSNPIRKMIGLKILSDKGPDIYAIFQWLLDATDHAWQYAEKTTEEYRQNLSVQQPLLQCTIHHLRCQKAIYNLSIRVPVMRRHYPKKAPISDLGMIRFMKDELAKWEAVERSLLSIITAQSDDLTDVYRKRLERLEIIEWLAKYTPSRGNSFFSKYQDDLKQTRSWLRKGHVAQLVNHHEREISAAAPKPSTAPAAAPAAAPISVKPSPMKVAPRPSTGWDRSMYNKRVKEQTDSMIKK